MPDEGDQPRNVKDLQVEAKDASELMVDLAHPAVFFNDDDHSGEADDLEAGDRVISIGPEESAVEPDALFRAPAPGVEPA